MLLDSATSQVCPKTLGKFIGLPSDKDKDLSGTLLAGSARVSGRWLIQECLPDPTDGQTLGLRLGGIGWAWAEQAQYGFQVRQYVYFRATAYLRGALNVAYDANAHIGTVWLTPLAPPQVGFTPLSNVNAHPTNFLTGFLSVIDVPGIIDDHARSAAEQLGSESFVTALSSGATITFGTLSGQMDLTMGQLHAGQTPRRPFPLPTWLVNERQELHPGGVEITGPLPFAQSVQLLVYIEPPGGAFAYGVACAQSAQAVVAQLASGSPMPPNARAPTGNVQAGQLYRVPLTPPPCDWVLVTYASVDTTADVAVLPAGAPTSL